MTDWRIEVPASMAGLVSDFGPLHPDATQHMVDMHDGARLATDVYLPDPLRGRVPAVLIRTCYDKSGPMLHLPEVAQYFAGHGYAAVVQDVRGRFRSEGDRVPFVHEVRDGHDTLDWIVDQSWSDGVVGMWGPSYLGFAQWAAAASGHRALRALSLSVTSQIVPPNWWGTQLASAAGAEWLTTEWACAARLEGSVLDWGARPFTEIVPAELGNTRALLTRMRELGADPSRLQEWAFGGPLPARSLRIPALHSGGWWDPINSWALRDWDLVTRYAPAAADQQLTMAATDHMGMHFGHESGAAPSTRAAARDPLAETVAFFDHWLRGRPEPAPRAAVRYEIARGSRGAWVEAETWPPPGLRTHTLHLVDAGRATSSLVGGALSANPDHAATTARWIHDPSAPVPALAFGGVHSLPHEAAAHLRADVATFTTEPLRRPMDIVGPVRALLEISSTAPSTHLIATLIDLAPDGVAHQLVEGIALVDTLHGATHALVELGSVAYRLGREHRLRLAVASSRFPTYLPHPGTNDDVWTTVETRPASQELRTGGALGSQLLLSVRAAR